MPNVQIVIARVLVAVFLVATAVTMHNFLVISDEQIKMVEMTQFMKNMMLTGAALAIAALLDLTAWAVFVICQTEFTTGSWALTGRSARP